MNVPKPETQVLLAEQTEALTLYLDALFADKPVYLPAVVNTAASPVVLSRVIELSATRVESLVTPVIVPAPVVAPPIVTPATPAPAVEIRTQAAVETTPDEPRPDWANEPFPCLLLKVHGLSLALPLVKLNRILPWAEPTLIPGYAAWLLGVLRLDGLNRNLKVVDTAALVMPERKGQAPSSAAMYQHVVMIGDGEWGLTCEDVSNVITIDPAKVRWRTSRSKRPWLAGTVVEHLCALLDAERLAEMLSAGAPDLAS
jgi:purine-binding chemotaxis protein CheW